MVTLSSRRAIFRWTRSNSFRGTIPWNAPGLVDRVFRLLLADDRLECLRPPGEKVISCALQTGKPRFGGVVTTAILHMIVTPAATLLIRGSWLSSHPQPLGGRAGN